jgi:pimeloyl-ACP methyl ester carboxylesterase
MSTSAIDSGKTCRRALPTSDHPVRRTPFYFQSQGRPLFAWLHESTAPRRFDHGVIICPPIGYEQLHSHRTLRHLADALSRESIPTMRFDWDGTGDSTGIDEDPDRYSTWLENVRDAVRWMREHQGCQQISLIGLRMGATLAAIATTGHEIGNLVLWAPVMKGRAYVREMKVLSLTSDAPIRTETPLSNDIEAAGFTLSAETAAALGTIDMLQTRPECQRALVVSRDDLPTDHRLCNHLRTLEIAAEQITVPGFAQMMAEPHRGQVPDLAIHQITAWLSNAIAVDGASYSPVDQSGSDALSASGETDTCTWSDAANGEQFRESTIPVSSSPELFGIVTEPVIATDPCEPMIVLLNAGSSYRIGPGRLNVVLARHLAAQGFRCLRMDLGGLGDSRVEPGNQENDSYPATAFRDIDLTLNELTRRFGAQRFVLMGLCSGAYAAFQAAAQIRNPALTEAVLINPLTFYWKDGMSLDAAPSKQLVSYHYYAGEVLKPQKWLKLLSGRSKIGIAGAIRLVARRLKLLKISGTNNASAAMQLHPGSEPGHPKREDLSGDLKSIAASGRHLGMFFSTGDPGFSILNFHAQKAASAMQSTGRLKISFLADSDHTFSLRAARTDLANAISDYLCRRYQ